MNVEEMLAEARSRIRRSTAADVDRELVEGAVVIDLRCPEVRRMTGMIPGSVAIGRSVLEWRCDPASAWSDPRVAHPERRVVLVCEEGYSSSLAADALRQLGFEDVGDLVGGMEAWLADARPVVFP